MAIRSHAPAQVAVTTTDVLKVVAVALMVADHVGLFFWDNDWLRVAGRPVALIFGFLIGLAGPRPVPSAWIGLGVGLSVLNRVLFPDDAHALDVLLTLALARLAVPAADWLAARQPLLLAAAAAGLGLATEAANVVLEYGAEVPMLALLGAAVRLGGEAPAARIARLATAAIAAAAVSVSAIAHFELEWATALACVATVALTVAALAGIRRAPVTVPAALAPALRWIGRNTLWLYAAHLALFMVVAAAIDPGDADDADDSGDDSGAAE